MLEFVSFIADFWKSIFSVFAEHPISIGDYEVSFYSLVFAFLVIGFAIAYFWKGAKS